MTNKKITIWSCRFDIRQESVVKPRVAQSPARVNAASVTVHAPAMGACDHYNAQVGRPT